MKEETVKFKVSARVAELLGEQSVSDVIVAVTELVKNGYDADANHVKVSFQLNDENNLQLIIEDNGHGMTYDDLTQKWMVIGTDDKIIKKFSYSGRRKVGEKGIGRFAVQRLGENLEMILKPKNTEDEFHLKIDWNDYKKPNINFDDVENKLTRTKRENQTDIGTTLIISNLRDNWNQIEIEILARKLRSIIPPFWDESNFSIFINAPHLNIHEKKLNSSLFEHAAYELQCDFDNSTNNLNYKILLSGEKRDKKSVDVSELKLESLSCGSVKFTLYYFPLGSSGKDKKLSPYVLKDNLLKEQLRAYHGIKIFRDGFMIKPYGEAGNDWLGLNQQIVERRDKGLSNNTVIGIIEIGRDSNDGLIDTTTREGLIKNDAFYDLIHLIKACIQILINQRSKDYKEEIPELYANPAMQKVERAAKRIVKNANSKEKLIVENALQEFKQSALEIEEKIISIISMYRGLASLGISVAAIAHEIGESIGAILQRTNFVMKTLEERPLTFTENKQVAANNWNDILKIREFISFAAVFTSAKERKKSFVNPYETIQIVLSAYRSLFRDQLIEVQVDADDDQKGIYGYKVDFEALLINLVTNAIESMKKQTGSKKIKITCKSEKGKTMLRFSDSGQGIPAQNREMIFEPFWTNKKEGTGLGLTIIKEITEEYDGNVTVTSSELDEGATFLFYFPTETKI